MQNPRNSVIRAATFALGLAGVVVCGGCKTNSQIYFLDRGYIAEQAARAAYLEQTRTEEPEPIPQLVIKF
ncbi:hypothetical protein FJZ17_01130 [Candidatus Pacearchaeota archaeon]|nr:hypothetical protein [Candidatus Pacearchaeota archaeon]